MNNKSKATAKIIKSTVSLILISAASTTFADKITDPKEQCAGIVKAGFNDCASKEHACAGLNTDDGYENDWVWMPKGTCNKIAGGHVIHMIKKDS